MNGEGKMEETFTAGIRPGGLTDGREIRILICHILSEIGEPMGFDEINISQQYFSISLKTK